MLNTIVRDLIIKDGKVRGVIVKKDGQTFDICSDIVIAADGIQSKIARKAALIQGLGWMKSAHAPSQRWWALTLKKR